MLRLAALMLMLGGGAALTQQGLAQGSISPGSTGPGSTGPGSIGPESTSLAELTQPAEDPSSLPAGVGQEEVFYACTACHSTALIRRSRFSRERWDELMTWMTETHGMNPLEGEERTLIVAYLAEHFGPAQGRAGARNPFLN
jgi:hypothetical protein